MLSNVVVKNAKKMEREREKNNANKKTISTHTHTDKRWALSWVATCHPPKKWNIVVKKEMGNAILNFLVSSCLKRSRTCEMCLETSQKQELVEIYRGGNGVPTN
jgi:hypothetical protein